MKIILAWTAIIVFLVWVISRFFPPKHMPAIPRPEQRQTSVSIGIGVWIYVLDHAEGGNVQAIVKKAKKHNLGYLIVCTARGSKQENSRSKIKTLFKLCRQNGILPISYQRCLGKNPKAEAKRSLEALDDGAEWLILDMETEYEGKDGSAMAEAVLEPVHNWILANRPGAQLWASVFGLRQFHAAFPWPVVDKYCSGVMPQWYSTSWRHTQGWDMKKSLEYIEADIKSYPNSNYIPTLQAYGKSSGFEYVTPDDLRTMLQSVDTSRGVNIFRWELMDEAHWKVIDEFTRPNPS